ncbi:hypothetical protein TNCV_1710971 [Trichonephila clavipes]|nr:hypothetical protein TNCV_1710971 [Trichonephila clavipes]
MADLDSNSQPLMNVRGHSSITDFLSLWNIEFYRESWLPSMNLNKTMATPGYMSRITKSATNLAKDYSTKEPLRSPWD